MSRPPLPAHTSYRLQGQEVERALPPHVLAKVKEIAQLHRDEAPARDERLLYAELSGSIDHPYQEVSRLIMLWIGSHDRALLHIHVGGSSCWIQPNNHYLCFDGIREDLLPLVAERDPSTWWIVHEPEYGEPPHPRVYRVQIVSEEQVPDGFPDL
jgi:hypothetical protein